MMSVPTNSRLPVMMAYHPGPSSASSDKASPLSNLNFFKNLNPEKKQTKGKPQSRCHHAKTALMIVQDGQPPKRRGPKPDSKPALTRRQELNRQAQRYVHGDHASLVHGG